MNDKPRDVVAHDTIAAIAPGPHSDGFVAEATQGVPP